VESTPRAYRLKAGNAASPISTFSGAIPARDELGITETLRARPIQAAFASALSFAIGAAMPLLTSTFAPERSLILLVPGTSLLFLALLGALAAGVGGAGLAVGAIRVTFWGALAMGLTAGVGALFGTVV
jgi:VIT1/CCC1 family predicted Fe2+/Mn2+ transporter